MSDPEQYSDCESCPLFKDNHSTKKSTVFEIHQKLVKNNIKKGYTCITELDKLLSSLKSVPDSKCIELLFKFRIALAQLDDTSCYLINQSNESLCSSSSYTEEDAKTVKEPEVVPVDSKIVKEPETVPVDSKIVKEPETVTVDSKIVKEPETVTVDSKIVKEPETVTVDSKIVKEPETVPVDAKIVKKIENRTFLENEVPLTNDSIFNMDYPTLRIPQQTGPYSGERLSGSVEKTNKFSPNPSNCTYFMKGNCNHKEKCHFYHPGKHHHRLLVSEAITSYKGVNQALKLLKEGKTDDKNTFLSETLGFGTHVFVSEKKLCLVTKEELDEFPEIAKFHLLRTFINGSIRQKDYVINFVKKHL